MTYVPGVELTWVCPDCHKKIVFGPHADATHIRVSISVHTAHHHDRPVERPRQSGGNKTRRYYAGEPDVGATTSLD